jgi:hypothetical protein
VVLRACHAMNILSPPFNLGVGTWGGGDACCSIYMANPLCNLGVGRVGDGDGDGDLKILGDDETGVEATKERVGDGVDGVGDGVGRVGDGTGVSAGTHFRGRGITTFFPTTCAVTGVAAGTVGLSGGVVDGTKDVRGGWVRKYSALSSGRRG